MPQVMTTNAIILCPHLGRGISSPIALPPKWIVKGGAVLLENDSGIFPLPPSPTACIGIPHCAGYTLRSMGLNATRIDGRKVMLTTDFNQTFTGLPLTMTEIHPIIDNTTPAPIPAGQPAPPLPPELLDIANPVVTKTPSALKFNSITMLPPTLAATFTLTSAHPWKWILTLIDEPLKTHTDLTNGQPLGLTLSPSGGNWQTPTLSITMSMTSTYLSNLLPGNYHFFMTGVSRRGLSGFSEITLSVS